MLSRFNDNTELDTLQNIANLYIYILVLCYVFVFLVFKISTSSAQDDAVHEMYHTRVGWSMAPCSPHLKDNPKIHEKHQVLLVIISADIFDHLCPGFPQLILEPFVWNTSVN